MKFALLLIFIHNIASAAIVSIPLDNAEYIQAPASDLVFNNSRINAVQAMELEKSGVDLSMLDPYESQLFSSSKNSLQKNQLVLPAGKVTFHSILNSPTEFFRASVNINNENYTVSASLYNHQTMIRAGLLSLIGYKIQIPIFKHNLRVEFSNLEEKQTFIDSISQSTLLSKTKWIKGIENDTDDKLFLNLKGVLIEPADLKTVPVYWPIMDQTRQKNRRTFRSLIYLFKLTDFPQEINKIPWRFGKIFNESLILDHAYGAAFTHVTLNDYKWIHQKIESLSSEEILKVVRLAKYPESIEKIIFEKVKNRINKSSATLGLTEKFNVDMKLKANNVINAKLQKSSYPDYVPTFWIEDPLSPYRFSEIFKLFRSQITYDSISEVLDKSIKKFLPNIDTGNAFEKIREKIKSHANKSGAIPLKFWSYPTIQGSASGSRSIVFGQYLGTNAPIQLVDNIQYKFNLGLFSYLSGVGTPGAITPTISANAALVRNYTHIRAMPDLSEATNQSVKKVFVPGLLKKLGKVLKNKFECSIEKNSWVSEEIVNTFRMWVVYYNKDIDSGKENALKLRDELIGTGVEPSAILLSPISKTLLCEKEINEKRSKNLKDFIKEFAFNETLSITDSIKFGGSIGAKIDVSGIDQLKYQFSVEKDKAILRNYNLRKVSEGIEVTIQTQNNLASSFEQGIKFYIDLIKNNTQWMKGNMISKVYFIKLEDLSPEEEVGAINTLREILIRNSYSHLKENYNPIDLNHLARVKLNTFRFFWNKTERLRMNQEIKIIVPNSRNNFEPVKEPESDFWLPPSQTIIDLPEKDRTRTVYTSMSLKRSGANYHQFLDRIINDKFSWLRIGSQDKDPGNSIYGYSRKRYFFTESELTEGREASTTTKIEISDTGWSASPKKLENILKKHEKLMPRESNFKIDRGQFSQTSELRSYDIKTTIMIYPSAVKKIQNIIMHQEDDVFINFLKKNYGIKKWKRYCRRKMARERQVSNFIYIGKKGKKYCIPPYYNHILKIRKKGVSTDRKQRNNQIHALIESLFERADYAKLLSFLGEENFLANIYIGGYRNRDTVGYLVYTSDTLGRLREEYGTGLLDKITYQLGLTPYLVKGMAYTPNM